MSKQWKLGVIGASRRGTLARIAHQPENNIVLKAAADPYEHAILEFKEWASSRGHTDYYVTDSVEKVIHDPELDGVFITAPDFLHEEFAVEALIAGKAVSLEKPMAISIEGCDRILEASYKSGSKLMVGHNMRYMDFVLKMKEIIDGGVIGELQSVWCRHFINYGGDAYFKDWHSERKYSNSLLLQKGAHDIDVIHWLARSYTKTVSAMGKLSVYQSCQRRKADERPQVGWNEANWPPQSQTGLSPVIDVEDHNMMLMQLENGVQACYLQSHYAPDSCRNYTFIGTKGRIENIGSKKATKIIVKTSRNSNYSGEPDITYHLDEGYGGHGGSDPKIVNNFLDFMIKGVKPDSSAIAARNSVAAGVCAAESLRGELGFKHIPAVSGEIQNYFKQFE